MEDLKQYLIDRVKEALPLRMLTERRGIAGRSNEKIMAEIGLSFDAYGDLLSQIEDELGVSSPPEIRSEFVFEKRSLLWFLPPARKPAFELRVPDLSVEELVDALKEKEWPAEFYIDLRK